MFRSLTSLLFICILLTFTVVPTVICSSIPDFDIFLFFSTAEQEEKVHEMPMYGEDFYSDHAGLIFSFPLENVKNNRFYLLYKYSSPLQVVVLPPPEYCS